MAPDAAAKLPDMELQTAAFWLDTIAASGVAVWLLGAWFTKRTRALLQEPNIGEVEVAVRPAALLPRLTATIAEARIGSPFANCVIDSATATELRWHSDRGPHAHRGVVQVTGDGRGTRVSYGVTGNGTMLRGAMIALSIGAVVLPGLYLLLHTLALPSENPNLRGQVLQMGQCVHALWPPFLFAGLARGMRKAVRNELERTLRNAAFVDATVSSGSSPPPPAR